MKVRNVISRERFDVVERWNEPTAVMGSHLDWTVQRCKLFLVEKELKLQMKNINLMTQCSRLALKRAARKRT